MIGAIVYSVTIYRDNFNNGFISYGQSLKLGTSVVFFASVILAFYTFIFVTFINPEYLENIFYDSIVYDKGALDLVFDISSSEHIMFGTDQPMPHDVDKLKEII